MLQITERQLELLWSIKWAIEHGFITIVKLIEPEYTNEELQELAEFLKEQYWELFYERQVTITVNENKNEPF